MKRDIEIDLHFVMPAHLSLHERLVNWSRYVKTNPRSGAVHPMFRSYRSSEVWGSEGARSPVDTLDGHRIEKAVGQLPEKNRDAIRWHYCYVWVHPSKACRHLGVTRSGLAELIHGARSMLNNRSKT